MALKKIIIRFSIFVAVLAVIIFIGYFWGDHIPQAEAFIANLGLWGPVIYILLIVVLMILFVPNISFALAAGALFGLWKGILVMVIAGLIAEMIVFFMGHKLFRKRIEKRIEKHPKLMAVRGAVTKQPIRLIFLLRLSPLPFTPICYMLSTTRIKFRDFIIGSLGFIPGNFVSVYFGFVAKHMAKKAANVDDLSSTKLIIAIVGFVITIFMVTYISHIARKAINAAEKTA